MQEISTKSILERACNERAFSAYSLYAEGGGKTEVVTGGITSYWETPEKVTEATYFDIGSVTKAVCTATLFALGVDAKEIRLTDTPSQFLPKMKNTAFDEMTVGDLLAHCAGFIPWTLLPQGVPIASFFVKEQKRILREPPRETAVYSDLGFLLLGEIAKKVWGDLNDVFETRIAGPLKLAEVHFGGPKGPASYAATEFCLTRRRLIHGKVFDHNTEILGGVSSHAGLFATARGLAPFCREWLLAYHGESKFLSSRIARLFASPAGLIPGSTRGYGWDFPSQGYTSSGRLLSKSSFGHLGFPGTSIWMDPERRAFVIFLTNRIHPSRFDSRIREIRPQVHNAVVSSLFSTEA